MFTFFHVKREPINARVLTDGVFNDSLSFRAVAIVFRILAAKTRSAYANKTRFENSTRHARSAFTDRVSGSEDVRSSTAATLVTRILL